MNGIRTLKCEQCGKDFFLKKNFEEHKHTHIKSTTNTTEAK